MEYFAQAQYFDLRLYDYAQQLFEAEQKKEQKKKEDLEQLLIDWEIVQEEIDNL